MKIELFPLESGSNGNQSKFKSGSGSSNKGNNNKQNNGKKWPLYLLSFCLGSGLVLAFNYTNLSNIFSTNNTNKNNIIKDYTGTYMGTFGNYYIILKLESIDDYGIVKGYNVVNGNNRRVNGIKQGNKFILNEPGDHEWDGIFDFKIEKGIARGTWRPNSPKLTPVTFSISKK